MKIAIRWRDRLAESLSPQALEQAWARTLEIQERLAKQAGPD